MSAAEKLPPHEVSDREYGSTINLLMGLSEAVKNDDKECIEEIVFSPEFSFVLELFEAVKNRDQMRLSSLDYKPIMGQPVYYKNSPANTDYSGSRIMLFNGQLKFETYNTEDRKKNTTFLISEHKDKYYLQWSQNRGCFPSLKSRSNSPKPVTYVVNNSIIR